MEIPFQLKCRDGSGQNVNSKHSHFPPNHHPNHLWYPFSLLNLGRLNWCYLQKAMLLLRYPATRNQISTVVRFLGSWIIVVWQSVTSKHSHFPCTNPNKFWQFSKTLPRCKVTNIWYRENSFYPQLKRPINLTI